MDFVYYVEVVGMFCYHGKIAFDKYGSREEGYFVTQVNGYQTYKDMVEFINESDFQEIELYMSEDSYEYPIWKMIDKYNRIEHIHVANDTGIYEYELAKQFDDNVQVYERIQP